MKSTKDEVYWIISRLNGYALTAENTSQGCHAVTKAIDPFSLLQKWSYTNKTLKLKSSGYVLDISGGKKEAGADIILWKENDGINQKFEITSDGLIQSKLNNLCLDIAGEFTSEQGKIITWNTSYQLNQLWVIVPADQLTKEFIEELNVKHKVIRNQPQNEYCIEVNIKNISSNILYDPEIFLVSGTVDVAKSIEQNQTGYCRFYSKEKSGGLTGIIAYTIKGAESKMAILFEIQETGLLIFVQRFWGMVALFVSDDEPINEKLYNQMIKSKHKINLNEQNPFSDVNIFSYLHQIKARFSKGNKALISIEISNNTEKIEPTISGIKPRKVKPITLTIIKLKILQKYQSTLEKLLNVKFRFENRKLYLDGDYKRCYNAFGVLAKTFFIKKRVIKDDINYNTKVISKWSNFKINPMLKHSESFKKKLDELEAKTFCYYEWKSTVISCIGTSLFLDEFHKIIEEESIVQSVIFEKIVGKTVKLEIESSESEDEEVENLHSDITEEEIDYEETTDEIELNKRTLIIKYGLLKEFVAPIDKIISNLDNCQIKISPENEKDMKITIIGKEEKNLEETEKILKSLLFYETLQLSPDHFIFYARKLISPKNNQKYQHEDDGILLEELKKYYLKPFYIDINELDSEISIVTESEESTKDLMRFIKEKFTTFKKTKIFKTPSKVVSDLLISQFNNETFLTTYDLKDLNLQVNTETNEAKITGSIEKLDLFFNTVYEKMIWNNTVEIQKIIMDPKNIEFFRNQIEYLSSTKVYINVIQNNENKEEIEISYFSLDHDELKRVKEEVQKIIEYFNQ